MNQRVQDSGEVWRAVSWSWSPAEWSWAPGADPGRSPSAPPPRSVSMRVDTRHAPPAERFGLWRDLTSQGVEYVASSPAPKSFHAGGVAFLGDRRRLCIYDSDPVAVARSPRLARRSEENLFVGFLIGGGRTAEFAGDDLTVTRPGDLFVDDEKRSLEVAYASRHRTTYLSLPRDEVAPIFQGQTPAPSSLLAILNASRLAPVIRTQFATIARHSALMSDIEGGASMAALTHLVLAALAAGRDEAASEATPSPAILIAARRHIEMHLADPSLDVDDVAHAVGCSRTTLYRAFAEAGAGVAETIRDLRLERLRGLIEAGPISVGDAAQLCGYDDPRSVQRHFKARFGLSARDLQARARQS